MRDGDESAKETPERGSIALGARGGFGAKQENLGGLSVY